MIEPNAEWILFLWVLANQAGVPVPVVPALLGVGALAGTGRLSIAETLLIVVGATLCADLAWYSLGRWRASAALAALARLSRRTKVCIHRAQHAFLAHHGIFRLGARFLPEANPIAAALSGAAGIGISRFLVSAALTAALWAGTWTGAGYLFSPIITAVSARFGISLTVVMVGALVLWLPFRRTRRHRLLRALQRVGISPDELRARLERGHRVSILDVRSAPDVEAIPYALPGALWITPEELARRSRVIRRDGPVVMYGSGNKKAAGARAALGLWRAGIRGVRPLVGGLRGWRQRGFPVEALTPRAPVPSTDTRTSLSSPISGIRNMPAGRWAGKMLGH